MSQLHPRFQRTVELESERGLDQYIEALVKPNQRVIDLGCGSGDLLERLIANRKIQARGVEISAEGIKACIEKGLSVYQGDLDDGLEDFDRGVFDVVILNLTLSMLHNPDIVLSEVVRIGKQAIVTFYNSGFMPLRKKFFESGRMEAVHPRDTEWYRTPHIHPFSVLDFEELCEQLCISCAEKIFIDEKLMELKDATTDYAQDHAFAAAYLIQQAPPA